MNVNGLIYTVYESGGELKVEHGELRGSGNIPSNLKQAIKDNKQGLLDALSEQAVVEAVTKATHTIGRNLHDRQRDVDPRNHLCVKLLNKAEDSCIQKDFARCKYGLMKAIRASKDG